jgi:membrane protease YdiL (CAAX protease family)
MNSPWRKTGLILGYSLLAIALIGLAGAVWGGLILANMRTTPRIPWCLPTVVLFLWGLWLYLSGRGWPQSSRKRRQELLRAHPVSGEMLCWSFVAGIFAIVALAGCWIVAFQLFRMPPNRFLPGRFTTSPIFVAAIAMGASIVAPVTEESAVRGYLQTVLEQELSPITAIALSSLVFALAHVSQGVEVPKLFVYFLVGMVFGSLAYVNQSILPVIPVHVLGDLTFFLLVWPRDGQRQLIWHHPHDLWFWLHTAQAICFTVFFVLALRRLARIKGANKPGRNVLA